MGVAGGAITPRLTCFTGKNDRLCQSLGGLTGSLSYTSEEDGLLLLHPKGGDWIARAVPDGNDTARLDSFDDSSCKIGNDGTRVVRELYSTLHTRGGVVA